MSSIRGRLVRGLGEAAGFTAIPWVRRRFIDAVGIDPHPGTLNLALDEDGERERWERWLERPGEAIAPQSEAFCPARCYPARIEGRLPAAVVVPEVPGYPRDKLELVAAVAVRGHLSLVEGERVAVELCGPMRARAVLFDIDGTLVDSMGAYHEVARVAAEPYGLVVTREQVRRALVEGTRFWNAVVPEERPDAQALSRALAASAAREWPRVLREHARVFEDTAALLDALASSGIALGIVSGARPEVLQLLREKDILERFDAVLLGADVAKRKPDPEGILKCLARMGVAPEAAIYVGDTPLDMRAGHAAGTRAVGVLTGAGDSAALSLADADRIAASLARLKHSVEPW